MALVNFADLKSLLSYLSQGKGAEEIKNDYGKISSSTSGTILRKIVGIEQQGSSTVFGEPSFDINDLFQKVDGKGRSEEHTSELQSLMRISYAVFCLQKKKNTN